MTGMLYIAEATAAAADALLHAAPMMTLQR
jgi:hypothetical protein